MHSLALLWENIPDPPSSCTDCTCHQISILRLRGRCLNKGVLKSCGWFQQPHMSVWGFLLRYHRAPTVTFLWVFKVFINKILRYYKNYKVSLMSNSAHVAIVIHSEWGGGVCGSVDCLLFASQLRKDNFRCFICKIYFKNESIHSGHTSSTRVCSDSFPHPAQLLRGHEGEGDTGVFPSQLRDVIPSCPGSVPRHPLSRTCPKHFTEEEPRRHQTL